MTKRLLTAILIAVSGLAPAAAEPLRDDPRYILREVYSCSSDMSSSDCFAAFRAEMATNLGYEEAALRVCPDLVVADPKLRAVRNKKYRSLPEFAATYQDILTGYAKRSPRGQEMVCAVASSGDDLSDPYSKKWLVRR